MSRREYRYTGRFQEPSIGVSLPHPGVRIPDGVAPRPEKAVTFDQAMADARSTHPIEDEPLREAIRNALQRLALLPTAETLEESDAILTDVKRRLTRALNGESIHAA